MQVKSEIEHKTASQSSITLRGGAVLAILSKDALKKDQDQIRSDLLSVDARIHANAVQCLIHAAQHGDTSLMTRLLVETLGGKNGYRLQGLINWMRKHSPMELVGKVINLSGKIESIGQLENMKKAFPDADHSSWAVGERRPFLIDEANSASFWNDKDNDEKVRAVYQDTLLAPIDRVIKQMNAAMENTANGKPVDATKAFYDGVDGDKVVDFLKAVEALKADLPKDMTREIRLAQKDIADKQAFIDAAGELKTA